MVIQQPFRRIPSYGSELVTGSYACLGRCQPIGGVQGSHQGNQDRLHLDFPWLEFARWSDSIGFRMINHRPPLFCSRSLTRPTLLSRLLSTKRTIGGEPAL